MLSLKTVLCLASLHGAFLPALVAAYQWPDPQYEALERMLFEGTDNNDKATSILTNSCARRVSNGSPVAAEWLRLSYHDSSTKNITDGTGGLDASIYYELSRQENTGTGMGNSMNDFSASSNKYVSRSDLIALGVVWGVASCAGPVIPFRTGRIDATVAGRFGAPQPQEILDLAIQRFSLQGFNQTEMIGLVACGHTLGGVNNIDFPSIVQVPGPTLFNREFDGTDAFDNAVVLQYLNGTTKNPLVTISNTLFQSDLRIFQSDNNATMSLLANPSVYSSTCGSLLERMVNTVPSTVQLSDSVELIPFKVTRALLTVENSQFVLDVILRVAITGEDTPASGRAITIFWCDAYGANAGCTGGVASTSTTASPTSFNDVLVSPVGQAQGISFVEYEFFLPIDVEKSVSNFWFELFTDGVAAAQDNGGAGFTMQDGLIFIPQQGSASGSSQVTFDVIVGVRSQNSPTSASMNVFDNTFIGSPSTPFSATVQLQPATNVAIGPAFAPYTLYGGTFTTPSSTAGLPTVDFAVQVDGTNYTLDFVRPRGAQDTFPTRSLSSVSTTTVSAVPTSTA